MVQEIMYRKVLYMNCVHVVLEMLCRQIVYIQCCTGKYRKRLYGKMLIASSQEAAQRHFNYVAEAGQAYGLVVNLDKTILMSIRGGGPNFWH